MGIGALNVLKDKEEDAEELVQAPEEEAPSESEPLKPKPP
jgi:hypothetical protein